MTRLPASNSVKSCVALALHHRAGEIADDGGRDALRRSVGAEAAERLSHLDDRRDHHAELDEAFVDERPQLVVLVVDLRGEVHGRSSHPRTSDRRRRGG